MSSGFDFDREINREGTHSVKYDGRQNMFGKSDVIPVWVADMDFAAPPAVIRALAERAAHPIYGYTLFPDNLYDVLIGWMQRAMVGPYSATGLSCVQVWCLPSMLQ